MAYNVIDLIDKAIGIAVREKNIYKKIEKENCDIPSMTVMSRVLMHQVDKDIMYHENLKEHLVDLTLEEIDFGVYDKMSFLINELNQKMYVPDVNNTREYLKFSLSFQKDVYSLLIDLQGRFVRNSQDMYTKTYKALSDLITNRANYITTLENILK